MKNLSFLTVIVAMAVLLGACSHDENKPEPKEEKAVLLVKLGDKHTKAAGAITDQSDNGVTGFTAFAFTAIGTLQEAKTASNQAGEWVAELTNVTTAVTEVVVVANIPSGATFDDVNKKEDLEGKLALLYTDGTYGTSTQTSGNILATGSKAVTFSPADGTFKANVDVDITFVPARITLTVDNQMTTGTTNLTINSVAILNALGKTKYISSTNSLVPSGNDIEYLTASSVNMDNFMYKANAYKASSFLVDTYNAADPGYHFYVFENDTQFPTILTLVATWGTETRYFPVHFSPAETLVNGHLERGKSYNVAITLTGSTDKEPGTPDPTIPLADAEITVTVTVNTWDAVTILKTFDAN